MYVRGEVGRLDIGLTGALLFGYIFCLRRRVCIVGVALTARGRREDFEELLPESMVDRFPSDTDRRIGNANGAESNSVEESGHAVVSGFILASDAWNISDSCTERGAAAAKSSLDLKNGGAPDGLASIKNRLSK